MRTLSEHTPPAPPRPLRAVIVDDERRVREAVAELIARHCPGVEMVGMADSVASAIDVVTAAAPDIVLLDIEMPERNGFELLAAFSPLPFKVIFITAYDRYALRAIKLSALDYLLKPVDSLELRAALAKAAAMAPATVAQIDLMNEYGGGRELERVAIPTEEGFVFVSLEKIVRCGSESNYTRLYLTDGSQILSSRTLGDYEDLLADAGFFRVHHSHMINIGHAVSYRKGKGGSVLMSDGAEIEVSVRRKEGFLERIRRI
jgi:two-component system LytT family response regulator